MIVALKRLMHGETWRERALRLQRENDILLLRCRRAIADRDRLAAVLSGPIEGCVGGPHVRGADASCRYCEDRS